MAIVRFHLLSTLAPAQVRHVLTDFGPSRPQSWPSIDAEHFVVHERGDSWADVTEGTATAWERARYGICIATVFTGAVAAWLWAEAALFHGVPYQSTW
ncbi:hypothetical protein ACWIGW_27525 [Nocardia brasiliensis]